MATHTLVCAGQLTYITFLTNTYNPPSLFHLSHYRLLQEVDESLGNGARVFNDVPSPPHAVLSTAQQVMEEELKYRMIAETRRVLVKQLAEAEVSEVKANNKVCVCIQA